MARTHLIHLMPRDHQRPSFYRRPRGLEQPQHDPMAHNWHLEPRPSPKGVRSSAQKPAVVPRNIENVQDAEETGTVWTPGTHASQASVLYHRAKSRHGHAQGANTIHLVNESILTTTGVLANAGGLMSPPGQWAAAQHTHGMGGSAKPGTQSLASAGLPSVPTRMACHQSKDQFQM